MNDMERKLEQLGTIRKQKKLSLEARLDIRTRLQSHMALHPASVRVDELGRHQITTARGHVIRKTFKKPMIIGLIVALVLGGGTAFAAEATVPGDILYPVKIHVNEEVRSAFAVSDEAEARLQAEFAAERLKEAEELAARHELNAEVRLDLETRFTGHVNDADIHMEKMEEKHGDEHAGVIEADLDAALRAHTKLLNAIDADVETKHEVSVLVNSVHAELETTYNEAGHSTATGTISGGVHGSTDTHMNIDLQGSSSVPIDKESSTLLHGAVETDVHTNVVGGAVHVEGGSDLQIGI
jgi:hypothetical protein